MKALDRDPPPPRAERPATRLLHDEPNARVVAFHLLPGQEVPAHHSPSTVLVHVVSGRGVFAGEDGSALLDAGGVAVFRPGESHAIRASDGPLHFVAVITPGPR